MSKHDCPFKIGDTVFVAEANAFCRVQKPCPICFGRLAVTLILGNGERTDVECGMCSAGFQGPRGTVNAYEVTSSVEERTVTGIVQEGEHWRVYEHSSAFSTRDGVIFKSREAAEARRKELHEEALAQSKRAFESQFTDQKGRQTWSAGYHRKEIKRLERSLEWHKAKLRERKP